MSFFYLNMGGPAATIEDASGVFVQDEEEQFKIHNKNNFTFYRSLYTLGFKLSELTIKIYLYGGGHCAIRVTSPDNQNIKYIAALKTAEECKKSGFNILLQNCSQICALVLSSIDPKFSEEGHFVLPASFCKAIERHYGDAIAEHHEKYIQSWRLTFLKKYNELVREETTYFNQPVNIWLYNNLGLLFQQYPYIFAKPIYDKRSDGRIKKCFIKLNWIREENDNVVLTEETPDEIRKSFDEYHATLGFQAEYLANGGSTRRATLIFSDIFSRQELVDKLKLRAEDNPNGASSLTLKKIQS